ncbi:hypothetical protein [Crocosphaera sp.]|uniref:hypothetical protein n=1 Tax=Crocosphaera sp. TaxID=2729996 RepID=UPI003F26BD8D|nr:hypothetical protein [Crocosphaera sp.]
MTQEPFTPDIEQIKATSAKFKALFERMDAQILVLDDIIAQLEEENRRSPIYQYRLNKAKRLLNSNVNL